MRPLTACRMPALGEEFRRAREARGQSISDVAERLHIRSVYLAALENEDWAAIGAPVYIRGFMRTYARHLGLDPEVAVARFGEAPVQARVAAPAAPASGEGRRSRPSLGALAAIAVALALVGFVAYQYFLIRADRPAQTPLAQTSAQAGAVPGPAVSAGAAAASRAPAGESTPVAGPARGAEAGPPKLAVRLTETSWLRVVIDGKVALEGTFPPGTAKSFTGKVALVRVGNAGGVQLAVGGRGVGKLGADGDVVERRFNLSGE